MSFCSLVSQDMPLQRDEEKKRTCYRLSGKFEKRNGKLDAKLSGRKEAMLQRFEQQTCTHAPVYQAVEN